MSNRIVTGHTGGIRTGGGTGEDAAELGEEEARTVARAGRGCKKGEDREKDGKCLGHLLLSARHQQDRQQEDAGEAQDQEGIQPEHTCRSYETLGDRRKAAF